MSFIQQEDIPSRDWLWCLLGLLHTLKKEWFLLSGESLAKLHFRNEQMGLLISRAVFYIRQVMDFGFGTRKMLVSRNSLRIYIVDVCHFM